MRILHLSTALPGNVCSTEELMEAFPCQLPDGVRQNILNLGVASRHLVDQPTLASKAEELLDEKGLVDLCSEACSGVASRAKLSVQEVGYFVATYDANPFLSPGLSQLLVRKLGFTHCVKHVNLQGTASTAFPKALDLAENYLAAHPDGTVLICVAGVSSYWFQSQVRGLKRVSEICEINQITDEARRQLELQKWIATMQFFLFGDGVAAAIVSKEGQGLAVEKNVEVTNLRGEDYTAGYSRLAALGEPFKFGFHSYLRKEIPKLGTEYTSLALKELFGENAESITKTAKKWAVHTGSEKILNAMAEHHGIEREKLRESHEVLRELGNLAGASLPFILHRIVASESLSDGDIVLMVGYGWGFSAAASLLKFRKS